MLLALAASALAASAADAAPDTRNYSVTASTRFASRGRIKVDLVTGVAPFARASGSQAALDGVAIEVQGRTLIVRSNRSSWGGYPGTQTGPGRNQRRHARSRQPPSSTGRAACRSTRSADCRSSCAIQGSGAASIARVEVDQLKVGIGGRGDA